MTKNLPTSQSTQQSIDALKKGLIQNSIALRKLLISDSMLEFHIYELLCKLTVMDRSISSKLNTDPTFWRKRRKKIQTQQETLKNLIPQVSETHKIRLDSLMAWWAKEKTHLIPFKNKGYYEKEITLFCAITRLQKQLFLGCISSAWEMWHTLITLKDALIQISNLLENYLHLSFVSQSPVSSSKKIYKNYSSYYNIVDGCLQLINKLLPESLYALQINYKECYIERIQFQQYFIQSKLYSDNRFSKNFISTIQTKLVEERAWQCLLPPQKLYRMHHKQDKLPSEDRMSKFEKFFNTEYFNAQYEAIYNEINAWRQCMRCIEENPYTFEAWYNCLQELVKAHEQCAKVFKWHIQYAEELFNTVKQAYDVNQALDWDTDPSRELSAIMNKLLVLDLESESEEDSIPKYDFTGLQQSKNL